MQINWLKIISIIFFFVGANGWSQSDCEYPSAIGNHSALPPAGVYEGELSDHLMACMQDSTVAHLKSIDLNPVSIATSAVSSTSESISNMAAGTSKMFNNAKECVLSLLDCANQISEATTLWVDLVSDLPTALGQLKNELPQSEIVKLGCNIVKDFAAELPSKLFLPGGAGVLLMAERLRKLMTSLSLIAPLAKQLSALKVNITQLMDLSPDLLRKITEALQKDPNSRGRISSAFHTCGLSPGVK